ACACAPTAATDSTAAASQPMNLVMDMSFPCAGWRTEGARCSGTLLGAGNAPSCSNNARPAAEVHSATAELGADAGAGGGARGADAGAADAGGARLPSAAPAAGAAPCSGGHRGVRALHATDQ